MHQIERNLRLVCSLLFLYIIVQSALLSDVLLAGISNEPSLKMETSKLFDKIPDNMQNDQQVIAAIWP